MHISGAAAAIPKQLTSNEKSTSVPSGLARRDLSLPPGITKKIEAGGVIPKGIAMRFPTIPTVAPQTSSEISSQAAEEQEPSVGLDIVV